MHDDVLKAADAAREVFYNQNKDWTKMWEDIARAVLDSGLDREYVHHVLCSGDRKYPAGDPGHSCSCFTLHVPSIDQVLFPPKVKPWSERYTVENYPCQQWCVFFDGQYINGTVTAFKNLAEAMRLGLIAQKEQEEAR